MCHKKSEAQRIEKLCASAPTSGYPSVVNVQAPYPGIANRMLVYVHP
jgi:hypothetical protein